MTKEQLAVLLNGREYINEISDVEEAMAKRSGLVAIFGASDDLCELRGAIYDEAGCYGGGTLYIHGGKLLAEIDAYDAEVLRKHGAMGQIEKARAEATKVLANWDKDGYSWVISTDAPHATFDILEEGEKFCRGIVIDLKELPA